MDTGLQIITRFGSIFLGMGLIRATLDDWEIHLLPYNY